MAILNSLPTGLGIATETSNGLMSFEDKILVNKIPSIEDSANNSVKRTDKIKSDQLDTSKNEYKIKPNNLSAELIAMINGYTEPQLFDFGDGSLYTELFSDDSVTSEKRTPVGSIAVLVSDEYCNFITNNQNEDSVYLKLPKNHTLYFGAKRIDIDYDIPEIEIPRGVPSIITYSEANRYMCTDVDSPLNEYDYILGAFDGTHVTMFNGRYTVNGLTIYEDEILDGSTIKNFSLDPKKLSIWHGTILSDKTEGPYINVSFNVEKPRVDVVKEFTINIADQAGRTIASNDSYRCLIPENTLNKKFLYIYYDLGSSKLKAIWSSNDLEESIIGDDEKLILIGIIYNNKIAVGLNNEYISVNSTSLKSNSIEYADIFTGKIIIDYKNKKITASQPKTFINGKLISLTKNETQTISLTDDMITDITSSGVSYTLGAVRENLNEDTYKLIFIKTDSIKSLGLDAIPLATIKKYDVNTNSDYITIIKPDGNVVKSNNMISSGYTLPIDNETIVAILTTELLGGTLNLVCTTVPGTSVVDPSTNIEYKITKELKYQTVVENLHGLYGVLFNTESGKIEVIPMSNDINNKIYISLGFVYELNSALSYTALGPIVNHITLNDNRPANYAVVDGPDPDKGYDWSNNRLVLPKDIYLMTNSQYSLYCQNMSMNKYVDNDYILYEIGLPHTSVLTENVFNVNSPISGEFETRIVGKFKGNNSCLFKDINIHFEKSEGKELSILCIGDDTVDMNMPSYIKEYLTQSGYTPTMLGTIKNVINTNGYGMKNLSEEYGEGHKGWRLTDFMCKTKHKDGSSYYISNNPFMNDNAFDFSHYMTSNSYDKVDVVVISVGLNDITGYHTASAIEDIENLTIYQNIEQLPNMYKEMISSIQTYDSNIKIIINPTMIKGMDDDFNRKSLLLTETLIYDLKDIQNVFVTPGYLTQPIFVSANKTSTENYNPYNEINDTKVGSSINSTDINGIGQSNLAYLIASTIVGVTK